MNQALSIWAPVVVASLPSIRNYEKKASYPAVEGIRRIDDIKVKVKKCQVELLGKAVDMQLSVDILCVLEDVRGRVQVMRQEETFRQRIPLGEFDRPVQQQEDLEYILQVKDLYWDGDLQEGQILIHYYLKYLILAVQAQVIQLFDEQESMIQALNTEKLTSKLQREIEQLTGENLELRRKIFFFERDMMSLRRGIKKAEKRNAELKRKIGLQEDGHRQAEETKLPGSIPFLRRDERSRQEIDCYGVQDPERIIQEQSLGRRIKRLFLNSS